jgi:hypothetical protein
MEFRKLAQVLFDGMLPVLESHSGVKSFAMQREKFDGWLTVELCRVLVQFGTHPNLSDKVVDVTFGNWALDVRTVNTNIPHEGCTAKGRHIKKEMDELTKGIWKLTNPGKAISATHRAILLLAYPAVHEDERWQSAHFNQLRSELTAVEFRPFRFSGDIPGVLYLGLCSEL